jgi:hypothetical protein
MEKYQDRFIYWLPMISFAKLMITLFFLGHWLGCLFYYFSTDDWHSESEKFLIQNQPVRRPTRQLNAASARSALPGCMFSRMEPMGGTGLVDDCTWEAASLPTRRPLSNRPPDPLPFDPFR